MSNDRVFLLHIRDALREVLTFIEGESYESFLANRMVQNAVMRSFEVVGEAARRVSPEFRQTHPEVPWRLMSDFRNKLIHDYLRAGPGSDLEDGHRGRSGAARPSRRANRGVKIQFKRPSALQCAARGRVRGCQ